MSSYSICLSSKVRDAAIQEAAALYEVQPERIYPGRERRWHVSHARQYAMWLIRQRKLPNGDAAHSYPEIGRVFGMDHTSALHACRRVAARLVGLSTPVHESVDGQRCRSDTAAQIGAGIAA